MKVNRSKVIRCLGLVQAGLSTGRETVVQASCFVFKGGRLFTFNDEIYCSIPLDLGFEGAVSAKTFVECLGRFKDDELVFTESGGEVVVNGKGKRAGFRLEGEVLLPIDDIKQPDDDAWQPVPMSLAEAFGYVSACCGGNEEQFHQTCVNVTSSHIEACDSYHMMRAPVELPIAEGDNFLVRGEAVKPLDGIGVEAVAYTDDWLCFRCPDELNYCCRRYLDDFPNLTAYFERQGGDPFVTPIGFSEGIEAAQIFTVENEHDFVKIRLKEGRMLLRGSGATGWFEQNFKVDYKGGEVCFGAPPKILRVFADKHREGVIGNDVLRVETSEFVYLTSLEPDPKS